METKNIYFKSDFTVILASEAQWGGCPFRLSFYTASPSRPFVACFDGENYHNCRLLPDGRLEIGINQKDGNVQTLMGIGKLMLAIEFYLDNGAFADHICNEFIKPFAPVFVDTDGTEYQVTLDMQGSSTLVTIGTLPAFYQKGEKGNKGDKGDQGIQGIQGEKGDKGDKGDRGEQGIQGVKGDTGATGATGAKGDKGEKGDKGDPFRYTDFTPEQLEGLRGPRGYQGETGPQGVQGIQGPKGDKGDKGEKGDSITMFPNVTIFGQPTIQESQISNFSADNYLQFPFVVDFAGRPWQIDCAITTGSNVSQQHNVLDSAFGLAFAFSGGKFVLALSSDGASWNLGATSGTHTILANTTYYIRISWNGSVYKLAYSTDKETWVDDITVTSSASLASKQIIIGKSLDNRYIFNGSINMAEAHLTISGKIVWEGMDDAGLATRMAIDLSNIDEEGKQRVNQIVNDGELGQKLSELSSKVGDLNDLADSVKAETIVGAINKAAQQGGGGGSTDETVRVVIRTTVEGVSVEGLKLYVYLNDDTQSPKTYTTDENGMCAFKVTADYKYRIVFPDIEGCSHVPDVVHTAVLSERAIEVVYEAEAVEFETVNVIVRKFENATNAPWANHTVKVVIEDAEYDYQTDDNGLVEFEVAVGKIYTVSVDPAEGLYIPTGYSHTFVARRTTRYVHFNYYGEAIGLYIVDKFGDEYSNTEWVAFGKSNEDALFIKIATPELLANEGQGVFYVKVDDIYHAEYLNMSKAWCTQNVQFNSIPADGNSPTALYYYDGKGASEAVLTEASERNLVVPAFTECNSKEVLLGNGDTMKGFLWSVGQNRALYNNREMLDSIIRLVRPDAVNDFSLLCRSATWTSTQQNPTKNAYCVSSSVSIYNKSNTFYILVCYAPSV